MKKLDIMRALEDREYFDGLSPEQQAVVSAMSPVGVAEIGDAELETVTGGLEGGYSILATTTTTDRKCSCGGDPGKIIAPGVNKKGGCACDC